MRTSQHDIRGVRLTDPALVRGGAVGALSCRRMRSHGFSMVETMLALAVLAVALPLVTSALVAANRAGVDARADMRSAWIIPACVAEMEASRAGRSAFLPATGVGESLPAPGDVWALGFGVDGHIIDRVPLPIYQNGVRYMAGKELYYLASLEMGPLRQPASSSLMRVTITLEYPAALPVALRRKLWFHTYLP